MGLFGPAYFSKNDAKRKAAIEKLSDRERIALFTGDLSKYSRIRSAQQKLRGEILDAINDQQFHASLLVALYNGRVRSDLEGISWRKVTDPALINAVYLGMEDAVGRNFALQKITDRAMLRAVALNSMGGRSDGERSYALEQLKEKTLAAKLLGGPVPRFLLSVCLHCFDDDPGLQSEAAARYIIRDPRDDCSICLPYIADRDKEPLADRLAEKWEEYGRTPIPEVLRFMMENASADRIERAVAEGLSILSEDEATAIGMRADRIRDRGLLRQLCVKPMYTGPFSCILNALDPDSSELIDIMKEVKSRDLWVCAAKRLSQMDGEHVNVYLASQLYGASENGISAMQILMKRTGLSEAEIACRYNSNAAVDYYLSMLRREMGRNGGIAGTVTVLRALYAAGIGRDAMADLAGKKLRDHYDYMPRPCEGDTHRDYPEEWFNV